MPDYDEEDEEEDEGTWGMSCNQDGECTGMPMVPSEQPAAPAPSEKYNFPTDHLPIKEPGLVDKAAEWFKGLF